MCKYKFLTLSSDSRKVKLDILKVYYNNRGYYEVINTYTLRKHFCD